MKLTSISINSETSCEHSVSLLFSESRTPQKLKLIVEGSGDCSIGKIFVNESGAVKQFTGTIPMQFYWP